MKSHIRSYLKKRVYQHKRTAKIWRMYRKDGPNAVFIEVLVFTLFKLGINSKHLNNERQAIFLYQRSKHLNFLERLLIAKKKHRSKNFTKGKELLKKGILPVEEI